jgi:hypothetical protein
MEASVDVAQKPICFARYGASSLNQFAQMVRQDDGSNLVIELTGAGKEHNT